MPPVSLLIKPASGHCQYRCKYCFYTDEMARRSVPVNGMMSEKTLEVLVRRALAYAEDGVVFSFQGGEPLLRGLEFYKRLISLERSCAKPLRISNCIQTNGGLIDDAWAEFFARNRFLVGLSIDGTRSAHDLYRRAADGSETWEASMRAAELLERYGVEFNILCVINREVAACPRETYSALKRFRYLQFIPCLSPLDSESESFAPDALSFGQFLIEIFDQYERDMHTDAPVSVRQFDNYLQMLLGAEPESCAMRGYCSCVFTIESDGSVYPCDFYAVDERRLGNVLSEGFGKLLKSQVAQSFIEESREMAEECKSCHYRFLCRGGCRRERESPITPDKLELNHYCAGYLSFFEARYERLQALAEYIKDKR